MKKTTLSKLKDGEVFLLALKRGIKYKVISKKKGMVTFTSLSSELSFTRKGSVKCFVKSGKK
jgi:hypothetical protein